MDLIHLILLVLLSTAFAEGKKKWTHFTTTWNLDPELGFHDQPKTKAEAETAGWRLVSNDCTPNAKFRGARFAPPEDDPEFIMIYDTRGNIAGMHSVLSRKVTNPLYNFAGSKWFQDETVFGDPSYVTTAYFVDPELICGNGRTQQDVEKDGTGDRLWFHTREETVKAPLTQHAAEEDSFWYKHNCFINMGIHYFPHPFNYNETQECDGLPTFQLMFSDGELKGFVWMFAANLMGLKNKTTYEPTTSDGLDLIDHLAPKCLYDWTADPGSASMHVYFWNYHHICKCDEVSKKWPKNLKKTCVPRNTAIKTTEVVPENKGNMGMKTTEVGWQGIVSALIFMTLFSR